MKILFVCKSLPPFVTGGIQTHTWNLSKALLQLGHEVSILTAGNWRKKTQHFEREGIKIIEIPYFPGRKLPLLPWLAEDVAFNAAADRWLKSQAVHFDIVHMQGRSGIRFAGKQNKTPVVATFHGLAAVENERSGRHQSWKPDLWLHEWWSTFYEKTTLLKADAIVAVSQEMLLEIETAWPGIPANMSILSNGVEIPASTEPGAKDSTRLVFVGRLNRIKGIYPLIAALQQVHPSVHLTMIGEGPDRAELERRIAAAGLQKRVTLTGALAAEQVFEHIRASFALVLPSFHETQGIVLMEANACYKPVIASDIPGIQEVVRHGETGWLVPAGDAYALANSINQLLAQPEEARRMGLAGRRWVEQNFAWENIALETERLYGKVLAQKSWNRQQQGSPKSSHNVFSKTALFSKFF